MSARGAPDRCPGILTLHQARDGALARVRLPGGRLLAHQLRALADVAATLGSGLVDLTVRANVQVRGLPEACDGALAERLGAAGLLPSLAHERVRNILASPLAGRDAAARLDARPVVESLDRLLCADAALAGLPGRFAFLVEDGSGAMAGLDHDVALAPAAWLGDRRTRGSDRWCRGATPVCARRRPPRRPWPPPPRGRSWTSARRGPPRLGAWPSCRAAPLRSSPGPRRCWAPTRGSGPRRRAAGRAPPPRPAGGVIAQPGGRVALGAVPLLGRLHPVALRALADACERGVGEVRISVWRTIVVPDLDPAGVGALAAGLRRVGLSCDAGSPWLGLSACAGVDGCDRALADVRSAAVRRADERGPGSDPEHHSGCERRCGEPAGRVVASVAGDPLPAATGGAS